MKKLLICALSLIPVSCMKVDSEQTFIYSKITVNETIVLMSVTNIS